MTSRADMQESESLHNNAICQRKYNKDDQKKKKKVGGGISSGAFPAKCLRETT